MGPWLVMFGTALVGATCSRASVEAPQQTTKPQFVLPPLFRETLICLRSQECLVFFEQQRWHPGAALARRIGSVGVGAPGSFLEC